ncbi:hypothetical protein CEP51_008176 [Fusarium floridanum]|uniref:Uncharacterized protein n=1 Tax=Fusarium floridanum TaxID=1325733 RepID=A0A428RLR2_9HYPO|nr:hypothetical protein CEP51_008176 [Fusarium floridanum]
MKFFRVATAPEALKSGAGHAPTVKTLVAHPLASSKLSTQTPRMSTMGMRSQLPMAKNAQLSNDLLDVSAHTIIHDVSGTVSASPRSREWQLGKLHGDEVK